MSDTLIAYVISVIILAVLALSVPCIELVVRLLRTSNRDERVRAANPKSIAKSRKAA